MNSTHQTPCETVLVAEDGVITSLQVEAPGKFEVSSAEAMLDLV